MSGVKSRRAVAEFQIGSRKVTKSLTGINNKKLRNESLVKRTKAELWARDILFETIGQKEIVEEYPFQFRRFDFYFRRIKVAVEIDGGYHSTAYQNEYDIKVDKYLYKKYRIKVFRVKNMDLDALMLVIKNIKSLLNESDHRIESSSRELSNSFKKKDAEIERIKEREIVAVEYNKKKKKYEAILASQQKVILRKNNNK